MKTITSFYLSAIYVALICFAIACNQDPVIEPPLPPPPVPDCSFNFTIAAVDTFVYPPPASGPLEVQFVYYQGYELIDVSFNPNDPNQLAVAVFVYRAGVIPNITSQGSVIIRVDLCSGVQNVIYASEGTSSIQCIDWSTNGKIVFVQPSVPHSVFVIDSDGNNLLGTDVSYSLGSSKNIKWHPIGNSFFITRVSIGKISQFTEDGQLMVENIGLGAQDFDFLPDGKLGYIKVGSIGIFDLETEESQTLGQMPYGSNRYDISYSAKHNSLFWAVDTIAALTDIETGQTTIVKEGRVGIMKYYNAAASTNGCLAYKTYVVSPTLSTTGTRMVRDELRFINADGSNERRLVLDFE